MARSSNPEVPVLTRCPVCDGANQVERVRCSACGVAVEGRFSLGWPALLTAEQLAFVRVFVECRGKIKDVEEALGLSYPTVVARLDEIVRAIQSERPSRPGPASAAADRRKQILDDLASGAIDVEEATRRLRGA